MPYSSLEAALYTNRSPGEFETEKTERGVLEKNDKVNQTWVFPRDGDSERQIKGELLRGKEMTGFLRAFSSLQVDACSHSVSGRVW